MQSDRRQRGQRDLLVQPHDGPLPTRAGDSAGRHREAQQNRQRHEHERDDA